MTGIKAASRHRLVWLALLACVLAGCLSQNPPENVRYFLPLISSADVSAAPEGAAAASPVRLGHVGAALHLGDRMVWRLSDVEVAPDDGHHWAESPAALVESVLRRTLEQDAGLSLTEAMDAPVLGVHVAAFEGNLPRKLAVVEFRVTVRNESSGTVQSHTARGEAPVKSASADTLARAMGPALERACADLAEWLKR